MKKHKLYGAILGDLAGQPYERREGPYENVILHNPESHVTDDTIMTLAIADSIINNKSAEQTMKTWGKKYPNAGYGANFQKWINSPLGTVNDSFGNGCLMRMTPYVYVDNFSELIRSTTTSHAHPNSVTAIVRLWNWYKSIKKISPVSDRPISNSVPFNVEVSATLYYCMEMFVQQLTTQEAIVNTVARGGDTDTNASIVGEYFNYYQQELTKKDIDYVESKLDTLQLTTLHKFNKTCKY